MRNTFIIRKNTFSVCGIYLHSKRIKTKRKVLIKPHQVFNFISSVKLIKHLNRKWPQ